MTRELDLVIIGGGPGGYVAAIRASQLGMRTCVVEKDPQFGGTCLHRGCIPTKALLHSAALFEQARDAGRFGVVIEGSVRFDPAKARGYRDQVVQKNARGIDFLLRKNGVETIHGWGRLAGGNRVEVATEDGGAQSSGAQSSGAQGSTVELSPRYVLLATGSAPRDLPGYPADGETILDSDQLLEQDRVPESLVVIGGGAVGVEFASLYASLGTSVALVEMLDRLVPNEDEEVSAELERCFRRRGIAVSTSTRVAAIERQASGLKVTFDAAGERRSLECEVALVAIGRRPNIDDLGLEVAGVEVEEGCVRVSQFQETAASGIYAIGDLVKTPWLAHVASAEGILAVEHMAGVAERPIDYDRVPSCTYCDPEVASVGLTESEARQRGHEVAVGKFPFSALGKSAILGKTEGFVKVVRETRYDQVLGVHIVGAHATDLIAEACVALQVETTTEELVRTIHAHPTLSEAVAEAAQAALGRPLHA